MKKIMNNWRKQLITESGFNRIVRMLVGSVPSVDTIGFITAENPQGNKLSPQENASLNSLLQKKIRAMNHGYIRIRGRFGNPERSFVIPKISREEMVNLGLEFNQEAIIWGHRDDDHIRFEYIEGDQTIQERDVVLVGPGIQGREDFYSQERQSAGRKFLIPFFDEDYEIDGGANEPIPDEEYDKESELVKEIRLREEKLSIINKTPKYYWHHRGVLNVYLDKLKNEE